MTAHPPTMWEALQVLQAALDQVRQQGERSLEIAPRIGNVPLQHTPAVARAIFRSRRKRERHFPELTFGDPMWDVLLDLYASEAEGKQITISSACIAASVPQTTGLRVLRGLEEVGLVERYRFGPDARRVHVRLSPAGRLRMAAYLQMHGDAGPPR